MEHLIFLVSIVRLCHKVHGILDDVENSDLNAVKYRLVEEKQERLLLTNDVEVLMLKVARLERECRTSSNGGTAAVYFTARRSRNIQLSSRDIVVFDEVLANKHEAYNSRTGILRAPIAGDYLFSLTGMSYSTNNVHLHIIEVELGKLYAGDGRATAAAADGGSVTVMAHLKSGDEVMVREKLNHKGLANGDKYCTFTGVLLGSSADFEQGI